MTPQMLEPLESISNVAYAVLSIAAATILFTNLLRGPNLDAFLTVGPGRLLGPWWAGFKGPSTSVDIIREGYKKHKSAPFKVADRYGWLVILSSREHLEELARAPEDELSFLHAIDDKLSFHHTLGREIHDVPYHIPIIRSRLTRNIETLYPDIKDEIVTAFDDILGLGGDEWRSMPAFSIAQKVVCRTSNRILAGLPLCRNSDWIDLNIQCNLHIIEDGVAIGRFPEFLRPLAACFFKGVVRSTQHSLKYLSPIIEERIQYANQNGKEANPNDLLSWLIEEAKGSQLSVNSLVTRVLFVNFGAIHTSAISFTHVLLYLAANPEYIQPLREEVERIVRKEGWSKATVGGMRKVDSFFRECQRMEGISAVSLSRKALKDFTFSDGTFIPKGTAIGAPSRSLQYDEKFYETPDKFSPFRFAEMHGEEDGEGVKHQFVSTSTDYLPFGHGRHTCPGRFFAAAELKTMLAHLVVTYDIKLEDGMLRPRSLHFGTTIAPDPHAEVLFRRRDG